jgi:hypothetical protein
MQSVAIPLVDTTETILDKLLTLLESQNGKAVGPPSRADDRTMSSEDAVESALDPGIKALDPDSHPNLQHTKVIRARFDGREARNWNDLVTLAHRRAMEILRNVDRLKSCTQSNIVTGSKTENGFRYLPDIDLSIQYVDANQAWKNILFLAKQLRVSVHVTFAWRNKKGAAHPGMRGVINWDPKLQSPGQSR